MITGASVSSFNTRTGAVTLTSGDVTTALTFTPQSAAQVATAVATETTRATTAEALLAPKASPTLTGVPLAPTAAPGTNTTQLATTAYSTAAVLVETTRALAAETLLAPKASPTFTGIPAVPTASPGTNTTQSASTAFVTAAVVAATAGVASVNTRTGAVVLALADIPGAAPLASPTFTGTVTIPGGASISGFAPLASPTFTGTPAAPTAVPTAAAGTTQLATTAFVRTGTTTSDNALLGQVGEFISSTVLVGAAVALTTTVTANITSISLTAGDWDVWGIVNLTHAGGAVPAQYSLAISTSSATFPTAPAGGTFAAFNPPQIVTSQPAYLPAGMTRILLSGTTTVFLIAQTSFTPGSMAAFGFIGARRAR